MADRAQLEATLRERGVDFDAAAADDALALMVEQTAYMVDDPAQSTVDRGALEQFLQARNIDYDSAATDAELHELVGSTQAADHERFLLTYQPVITRLPDAVGSSPEEAPAPAEQSEAEPDTAAPDTAAEPVRGTPGAEPATDQGQQPDDGQPGEVPSADPGAEPVA